MPAAVICLCVVGGLIVWFLCHVLSQLREEALCNAMLFRRLRMYE